MNRSPNHGFRRDLHGAGSRGSDRAPRPRARTRFALTALAATPLAVQALVEAPGLRAQFVVEGVVLDSALAAPRLGEPAPLEAHPLSGARVRARGAETITAVTDARGRFRLPVDGPGAYELTFEHPRLDSLGVESPGWFPVHVPEGAPGQVSLAIPSYRTLFALMCDRIPGEGKDGIVAGRVFLAAEPLDRVRLDLRFPANEEGIRGYTTLSEDDGVFLFCSVATGTDLVLATDISGLVEQGRPFRLEPGEVLALDLEAAREGEGHLRGSVQEGGVGDAVAGAVVEVRGAVSRTTETDGDGRFTVTNLPAGRYTVRVEHLAYRTVTDTVGIPGGDRSVSLDVRLLPDAIPLDPITVRVDRRPSFGPLVDVYDRMDRMRRLGLGHVFDRREIEESGAIRVSHLVGRVPGVRTAAIPGSPNVRMFLTRHRCDPSVYIDGLKWRGEHIDHVLTMNGIEAVEVYRRLSEIPVEFWDDQSSRCGVVAVWTRRGG